MVEQPTANHAAAGATACATPADLESVVDRLMALTSPDSGSDEIDRAVNRRAQMTLARTIRNVIDGGDEDMKDRAA